MTHDEPTPVEYDRAALAEAFDTRLDPLAKYAATFDSVDGPVWSVSQRDLPTEESGTENSR